MHGAKNSALQNALLKMTDLSMWETGTLSGHHINPYLACTGKYSLKAGLSIGT